jgi:hypothetical protein
MLDYLLGLSPLIGSAGGQFYTFQCEPGNYISKINGRGVNPIAGLQAECNDGLRSNWISGPGSLWSALSPSGWMGASGAGDLYVNQLMFKTLDGISSIYGKPVGKLVSWGGCQDGKRIIGFNVGASDNLNNIKFKCCPAVIQTIATSTAPKAPGPMPAPVVVNSSLAFTSSPDSIPAPTPAPAPAATISMNLFFIMFFFVVIICIVIFLSRRTMQSVSM